MKKKFYNHGTGSSFCVTGCVLCSPHRYTMSWFVVCDRCISLLNLRVFLTMGKSYANVSV